MPEASSAAWPLGAGGTREQIYTVYRRSRGRWSWAGGRRTRSTSRRWSATWRGRSTRCGQTSWSTTRAPTSWTETPSERRSRGRWSWAGGRRTRSTSRRWSATWRGRSTRCGQTSWSTTRAPTSWTETPSEVSPYHHSLTCGRF
ncbi:hypothetical protein CRUP_006038, partial [Coryphaenoides rupestris]